MTDERRPGSERVPDARYEHLVDHVQDAVVEFELIDGAPVIRSVNRAFVDTFGYEAAEVEGEPLNEWIVPDWREEEARRIDERTAAAQVTSQRVTRETADGLREFLHRSVPYDDPAQDIDGIAIYTDLTDITRHQRRLRVINRVLRHNLRNTANVITGHTTRLLDAFDGATAEETDVAATIERAAARLETLTREAADIERILNGGDEGFEIDCVPLVAQIAADYRRRAPAAAIETDHPESMRVAADTRLRVAVESLVENAIEHNPAAAPTVRIRVLEAEAEGWIRIHVDDDGPRIPADERAVVAGEAEITPTRHGTGLGLWLVKWTTTTFGGELSFTESDLGGNSVRLRLPKA